MSAEGRDNSAQLAFTPLEPRRLDAGIRGGGEQDRGDVLGAEPLAGARLTQGFPRRRAGEYRDAGRRRGADPDREILVGKIDGKAGSPRRP